MTRVNCDGTRRVVEAAGRAGVNRVVRLSSAAVYGAWENNPVPLTEDAVLRPNPGYLPAILDAECERVLAEWANDKDGRVATRLRVAPVVGAGSSSVLAEAATGHPPVILRARGAPVQVVHVDDVAQRAAARGGAVARGCLQRRVRRLARVGGCRRAAPAPASARAPVRSGRARAAGACGAAGSATRRLRSFPTSRTRGSSRTTA